MKAAEEEWGSLFVASAVDVWMKETEYLRRAAMILHIFQLELEKTKQMARDEFNKCRELYIQTNKYKADAEKIVEKHKLSLQGEKCDKLKVGLQEQKKNLEANIKPTTPNNKSKSHESPDLFLADALTSGTDDDVVVTTQVNISPKINKHRRRKKLAHFANPASTKRLLLQAQSDAVGTIDDHKKGETVSNKSDTERSKRINTEVLLNSKIFFPPNVASKPSEISNAKCELREGRPLGKPRGKAGDDVVESTPEMTPKKTRKLTRSKLVPRVLETQTLTQMYLSERSSPKPQSSVKKSVESSAWLRLRSISAETTVDANEAKSNTSKSVSDQSTLLHDAAKSDQIANCDESTLKCDDATLQCDESQIGIEELLREINKDERQKNPLEAPRFECKRCDQLGVLCSEHRPYVVTQEHETYNGFWDLNFSVHDPMAPTQPSIRFG